MPKGVLLFNEFPLESQIGIKHLFTKLIGIAPKVGDPSRKDAIPMHTHREV